MAAVASIPFKSGKDVIEMAREKKTILVIEDEKYLNDLICSDLEDAGYKPVPAFDGKQGLKMAGEVSPDLILLDIGLPDTDGVHVCRIISEDRVLNKIPVIIVTSRYDLQTKLLSFISGARRFITKPFEPEELIEQIELLTDHMCSSNPAGWLDGSAFPDEIKN